MEKWEWVFLTLTLFLLMALLSGCAGYRRSEDGTYDSYGFLRTLKVTEKYYESGALKERTIDTRSNTGEVLGGLNEVLGTTVGAARDAMP